MKPARIAIALLAAAAFVASAQAQELTGTLKKIKDTGSITLAVRESSIPFSYYDNQQNTIGYSYDIALRIVDAIKQDLKLAQLTDRKSVV